MSIFNAYNRELGRWERYINSLRDQRMNESGIERANAQQSLSELRKMQQRRMAEAKGRQSLGFTVNPADVKNGGNMELANGISNINANAEKEKRGEERMFNALQENAHERKLAHIDNRLNQLSLAGTELSKLGAGMAGSLIDGWQKRRKKKAEESNDTQTLTA